MTTPRQQRLNDAITQAIAEPKQANALYRCMKRGRDTRKRRLETLPGGAAFRNEARAIKDRCIDQQEALLERFVKACEARGCHVFVAADAKAANDYCVQVALKHEAKYVSKSKSLTTEETEVNHDLQAAGLQVVETDLGELIIQLVDEKPYHLVFPSVHKMRDDVAKIFAKATGKPVEATIESIMPVVRGYLRPIFLNTDIGMTGANVGVAETGTICIETNEGNARLVSAIGKVHICVMGMEKIVETMDDALAMVLAHPVSASGQLPTTYVTWMSGRNPLGADGQPRESHIVILDNGRRAMAKDPLMRENLRCIRCGACMNVCPTYGVVGGHTFGHIYPGPMGIPWTAGVHGLDKAAAFADLCVSCGLCKEICPTQIDMPLAIAQVKHRDHKENPPPLVNELLMAAETAAKIGCFFAPVSNWKLRNPAFRWVMEKVTGIDRRRELPPFARKTLRKRWAPLVPLDGAKRKVAFFHDIYVNYNAPELGMKALRRLEQFGCHVVLPEQQASGYPYIGYGDLSRAQDAAIYNVTRLAAYVEQGYDIVATEPTAAYCLRVSYPKLLPMNPKAKIVSKATHEYFAYLMMIEGEDGSNELKGRRYGFHCSCHQRPLGMGSEGMEWVKKHGGEIELIETGTCCGMAGTFGLKHGPMGYDLANAVGKPLFEAFKEQKPDAVVTESSVCAIHIKEGTGLPVVHPLELL
jgi:L-lactate dehydrogenase complex protein LldF